MTLAKLVGKLRVLPLKRRQLGLELLDEHIRENRRERIERASRVLNTAELVIKRFFFDARRPRSRDRGVHIGQPLHDDVLSIFERNCVVVFAILLERQLARFELLALFRHAVGQPV
jgi:hypothetical protein